MRTLTKLQPSVCLHLSKEEDAEGRDTTSVPKYFKYFKY